MQNCIASLASSLAATACTNIIRTAIVFVHNSFIKQFIKVLQPDKSLFKYHSNSSKHRFVTIVQKQSQTQIKHKKQLGQFYCKLVLKLQKGNNFSVIPIMIQFVILQLCHFTNQAQGDSRKFKYSNFTQKLILNTLFNTITKCCGFLTKNTKC